eukprot:1161798-Pelagomonas_calceolata.AAC.1
MGLDHQSAIKLARKLHAHSLKYANKLVATRHAIENNNASHSQVMELGASSNPPDPYWHSLFCSLVMEGTHSSSEPMHIPASAKLPPAGSGGDSHVGAVQLTRVKLVWGHPLQSLLVCGS